MNLLIITCCLLFINNCCGVPPSPTDHLWEEIIKTKTLITNIATLLEKFNSLYLMKLEERMNFMASTLSSIDSNVKNIQERAHVWDTFQLHVSAWNEQINTLDKKVDIISKGQEKMMALENKLQLLQTIDYKTERIISKVEENLSFLQGISKIIESQNYDPLLREFASRGIMSSLKTIERKLDLLQVSQSSSQSMLVRQFNDKRKSTDQEEVNQQKNKLLIKCNTPPIVEELLNDVASKVDVMFDKFTGSGEQNDESSGDDDDKSINSQESKNDLDIKFIKGFLKRLNQPCKKTNKILETLELSIKEIDNTTLSILENEQFLKKNLKNIFNYTEINKHINKILFEIENKFSSREKVVENYFSKQRDFMSDILKSEINNSCFVQKNICETNNVNYIWTEEEYFIKELSINSSKFGCEALDSSEANGVYIFQPVEDDYLNRSYKIRYCEIIGNNSWTVIQRRGINPEEQSFNLSWSNYKNGFGSLNKDFWFGNDFIHRLSIENNLMLRVELEDFDANTAWAEYNLFYVANETNNYKIILGNYRGNASDSLSSHNNSLFSTFDRTNDDAPKCCPCSSAYGGGWWFNSCFEANLNGIYYNNPSINHYFRGLIWEHWLGNYSLKKTKMMVRPLSINDDRFDVDNAVDSEIPEDP